MYEFIVILAALAFLMFVAYRGFSVIIFAPVAALGAVIIGASEEAAVVVVEAAVVVVVTVCGPESCAKAGATSAGMQTPGARGVSRRRGEGCVETLGERVAEETDMVAGLEFEPPGRGSRRAGRAGWATARTGTGRKCRFKSGA